MDSLNDDEFINKCCKFHRDIYANDDSDDNYIIPKNSNVIVLGIQYNFFEKINRIKFLHEGKIYYFVTRIKLSCSLDKL